jgi:hypothetical protein
MATGQTPEHFGRGILDKARSDFSRLEGLAWQGYVTKHGTNLAS